MSGKSLPQAQPSSGRSFHKIEENRFAPGRLTGLFFCSCVFDRLLLRGKSPASHISNRQLFPSKGEDVDYRKKLKKDTQSDK